MRIVQVCPYSWSTRGGVQTHVRQLSRHLHGRGHDVLVLAAGRLRHDDSIGGPIAEISGEDRERLNVRTIGRSVQVPFNGSLAPICLDLQCGRTVGQALVEFQPDVVHVHEPFVPGLSLSALWRAQAPVVATFHASYPASVDNSLYSLATWCGWPLCRRIACRLSVSRAAAAHAEPRVGGAMHIVPNGVDVDAFARARPALLTSGRNLLFVGRLDQRKGFDVAVRAFVRLCERRTNLSLLVVGTGPSQRALDDVPLEVRRRIVMLGEVEDDHLPSVYAAADVFVAPATEGESFGVVLLEAMASGRPIVATDIDGYREVVRPGVDALVVRPRDARGLADAIGRILDDPALASRLTQSARERVQQFSWSVVTDAIEETYRDIARATVVKSSEWLPRGAAARGVARGVAK